jgi:hypothetical protein
VPKWKLEVWRWTRPRGSEVIKRTALTPLFLSLMHAARCTRPIVWDICARFKLAVSVKSHIVVSRNTLLTDWDFSLSTAQLFSYSTATSGLMYRAPQMTLPSVVIKICRNIHRI